MSSEEEDLLEQVCNFCHSKENDELVYGVKKRLGKIVTHYHCLLLSSSMEQKGTDNDGILGFLLPDIMKELGRGKRLACVYCKRIGATIGCVNTKCRKVFHLPCGIKKGSLHQFFGQFKSFCHNHRISQKIPPKILEELANGPCQCAICYDDVSPVPSTQTIWAPCCKKDSLFHRECVQQLASSAGYFFKCPLCNNKEDFNEAMLQCGIFIPEQDASWETVPNAFEELLHRHNRCDFEPCRNPRGRFEDEKGTRWELILCDSCGSQGVHMNCAGLKWSNPMWECKDCRAMLGEASERDETEENTASDDDSTSNSLPHSPSGQSPPKLSPELPRKLNEQLAPDLSLPPPHLTPARSPMPCRAAVLSPGLPPSPMIPIPQAVVATANPYDVITLISDDSEDDIEIIDPSPSDCKELITNDGSKIKIIQVNKTHMSQLFEGDVKIKSDLYIDQSPGVAIQFEKISKRLALSAVTMKRASPLPSPPSESPDIVIIDDDVSIVPSQPMLPRRRMVSLPRPSPSVANRLSLNPNLVNRQQPQFRNYQFTNVSPRSKLQTLQQMNPSGKFSPRTQQSAMQQSRTKSMEGISGITMMPVPSSPQRTQLSIIQNSASSVNRSPRTSLPQPSPSMSASPTSINRLRPRSTQSERNQQASISNQISPSTSGRFQPMHTPDATSTVVHGSPQRHLAPKPSPVPTLQQILSRPLASDQGPVAPKVTHRLVQQDYYNPQLSFNKTERYSDQRLNSEVSQQQAPYNYNLSASAPEMKRFRSTETGNDFFRMDHPPSYEETMSHEWRSDGAVQQSQAASYQVMATPPTSSQWQTASYTSEQHQQQQGNVILQAGSTYLSVLGNTQPQSFIVAPNHLIQGTYIQTGNTQQATQNYFSSNPNSRWGAPVQMPPGMALFNVPVMTTPVQAQRQQTRQPPRLSHPPRRMPMRPRNPQLQELPRRSTTLTAANQSVIPEVYIID